MILGKRGHAEVIGLTGQVEAPTLVVETEEDLDQIDFTRPIYFLSQTTQSISLFQHLCDRMRSRATDLRRSSPTTRSAARYPIAKVTSRSSQGDST